MEAGTGQGSAPPEHPDQRSKQWWARVRAEWRATLEPGEQATILAWTAFTVTFVGLRALTHWIRAGHGPSGGGM